MDEFKNLLIRKRRLKAFRNKRNYRPIDWEKIIIEAQDKAVADVYEKYGKPLI